MQYALVERAITLGWPRERVLVIDDDLDLLDTFPDTARVWVAADETTPFFHAAPSSKRPSSNSAILRLTAGRVAEAICASALST